MFLLQGNQRQLYLAILKAQNIIKSNCYKKGTHWEQHGSTVVIRSHGVLYDENVTRYYWGYVVDKYVMRK
jgi:hypothetical protein